MNEFTVGLLRSLILGHFLFDELSDRFRTDSFIGLSVLTTVTDERLAYLAIIVGEGRALRFFCLQVSKDGSSFEHSA